MRRKGLVVAGGILVAIGIYLGTLFQGWELGVGESGTGDKSPQAVSSPSRGPSLSDLADESASEGTSPPDASAERTAEPVSGSTKRLDVIIDGREYLLVSSEGQSPQSISLEKLVGLIPAATGDDDGVRIRIIRRKSSRVTTELALQEKLTEAGVPADAQIWTSADDVK